MDEFKFFWPHISFFEIFVSIGWFLVKVGFVGYFCMGKISVLVDI